MSPIPTCLHKFLSIKQTQTCSDYRDEMFIHVFIPGIIYLRLGEIETKVGKDLSSTWEWVLQHGWTKDFMVWYSWETTRMLVRTVLLFSWLQAAPNDSRPVCWEGGLTRSLRSKSKISRNSHISCRVRCVLEDTPIPLTTDIQSEHSLKRCPVFLTIHLGSRICALVQ